MLTSVLGAAPALATELRGVITTGAAPVASARVTVFTPTLGFFAETRSGADGAYALDVPPGEYRLGVAGLGFDYVEEAIALGAMSTVRNFALSNETAPGGWTIIGNTLPELFDSTDIGILMDDGTVFFCHDTVDPIRFDPVTGQKTFPAGSGTEQGCMNASLRADGRIMMIGGQNPSSPGSFTNAVPWVKAYIPATDSWLGMPNMRLSQGRWYPGLARLADSSLLVMGGGTRPSAVRTDTCELFNLQTQTWSFTGSMLNPSEFSPCALLMTGEVLATWWPAQLYNPQSGQWRATGPMTQANRGWPNHSDHSLVVLADGRALALGVARSVGAGAAMGERYDPATGAWSVTTSPGLLRSRCEVVPLPDGRILVAAGKSVPTPAPVANVLDVVKWTDLYDPSLNSWRRVADMNQFREYHAVTLLVPDGRVITTGGTYIEFQFGPNSADIEAFSPPYLSRGVRPQIATISSTAVAPGETISMTVTPATSLTGVVLMGTGITTHWVDAGVPRRLLLPFSQSGSDVVATIPTDTNIVPVGHYLLFAMVDDIPSVGRIVRVSPRVPGDVNGDGIVNFADLNLVLANFGEVGIPGSQPGDADRDGDVDFTDLNLVLSNFGVGA